MRDVCPKTASQLSLVEGHAIGSTALEFVPDLLGRIEFRRVTRKGFDLQTGMIVQDLCDERSPVNPTSIPEQNDNSAKMTQKSSEEPGHMGRLEVLLLEANVETHVLSLNRYSEGAEHWDAVMSVEVSENGCCTAESPRPTPGRYEQKAALIKEGNVGAKSSGSFFLLPATGVSSNAR